MSANMETEHLWLGGCFPVMSVRGRALSFLILSPPPSKTMLLLEVKKATRPPCPHAISGGGESRPFNYRVPVGCVISKKAYN